VDGVCRVPQGTVVIESGAFKDCKELRELIIPRSLTDIECDALLGCENLKKITLPASVKELILWGRRREFSISDFPPFSLGFDNFTEKGLALELISEEREPNWHDWD
jgi:hypothetical protein